MADELRGPRPRRETVVSDAALHTALAAIAGVIEESHCVVGAKELEGLVLAHTRLYGAFGWKPDYALRDGVAVNAASGAVLKRPIDDQDTTTRGCPERATADSFACESDGRADGFLMLVMTSQSSGRAS